jgi:hypothetical protein
LLQRQKRPADDPALQQRRHQAVDRIAPVILRRGQHRTGSGRGVDQQAGCADRQPQRLLTQHVLACLKQRHTQGVMCPNVGHQVHSVQECSARAGEERLQVRMDFRALPEHLFCHTGSTHRRLRSHITDGHQPEGRESGPLKLRQPLQVTQAHSAAAH